jgi:transcriptional regulator GlxA family with amidase domain
MIFENSLRVEPQKFRLLVSGEEFFVARRSSRNRKHYTKRTVSSDRRVTYVLRALQSQPQLRPRELARMVRLSPSYLQRLFKAARGIGVREYSMELRLQLARKRLRTTFDSVKEIREQVGFKDGAKFSRSFKDRFGISPSAYQRGLKRVFTNK